MNTEDILLNYQREQVDDLKGILWVVKYAWGGKEEGLRQEFRQGVILTPAQVGH